MWAWARPARPVSLRRATGIHDISDELWTIEREQRNRNGYVAIGRDVCEYDRRGVNNSGVVNWSLGTLTGGQVSNVTVTVTAPASGSLTNVASVSSPTAIRTRRTT